MWGVIDSLVIDWYKEITIIKLSFNRFVDSRCKSLFQCLHQESHNTVTCNCYKVEWKLVYVITFGPREIDCINWMNTISEWVGYLHYLKSCDFGRG
jgi:hypothetical protein